MRLQPLVTTTEEQRAYGWRRLLAGLAIGAVIGFWLNQSISAAIAPPVIDPRMERACKWPQHHGEAMSVAVIDNKIHCWEMGRVK